MHSQRQRSTVFLLLVLLLFGGGVGSPQDDAVDNPLVLHVLPGASLQDAIDRAPTGATLILEAGTYSGSLVIEQTLQILGCPDDETRILGNVYGPAVLIRGEGLNVRLDHLTVSGGNGFNGHGLTIEGASEVTLFDVQLSSNAWSGVWVSDRSSVSLDECILSDNGTSGAYAQDFARLELRDCELSGNGSHGVFSLHYAEWIIADCEIKENWTGIWAWDASRINVQGAHVRLNHSYGAILSNAALLILNDTVISDNGFHGLVFEASSRGILNRCLVDNNGGSGLFAEEESVLQIYHSAFLSNREFGLSLSAGECIGGFDPKRYFSGRIEGTGNQISSEGKANGNVRGAICPAQSSIWPLGFVVE